MMKQAGFVVSASMAIVATQAMAHVGRDAQSPIELDLGAKVDADTQARIDAAVSKRDVRLISNDVFDIIVRAYGEKGQSLAERFLLAQTSDHQGNTISSPGNGGSTGTGIGCYVNCHSACHSACHFACHGSRGWR